MNNGGGNSATLHICLLVVLQSCSPHHPALSSSGCFDFRSVYMTLHIVVLGYYQVCHWMTIGPGHFMLITRGVTGMR